MIKYYCAFAFVLRFPIWSKVLLVIDFGSLNLDIPYPSYEDHQTGQELPWRLYQSPPPWLYGISKLMTYHY